MTETDAAREYVRLWRERAVALEAERCAALRRLSESEAVRRFVLVQGRLIVPPRPTSGLIEQQRIFARLRKFTV